MLIIALIAVIARVATSLTVEANTHIERVSLGSSVSATASPSAENHDENAVPATIGVTISSLVHDHQSFVVASIVLLGVFVVSRRTLVSLYFLGFFFYFAFYFL